MALTRRKAPGPDATRATSRARERERLLADAAAVSVPARSDVCVVGGGAAGLACAIVAAEKGANVVVLERDLECGRTILATGNGRCNFCNTSLDPQRYNQPSFVAEVMGPPEMALKRVLEFFGACTLAWVEEDGRLYPRSRQASSVRNVLLARARRAGVTLAPCREVLGASRRHGRWFVEHSAPDSPAHSGALDCSRRALTCTSLVIASGGASSSLADRLGLPLVPRSPALCALEARAAASNLLKALDGRRSPCVASLTRKGRVVAQEAGEVLFRSYGISGIVSFDLSRKAQPGDVVELDLAPQTSAWEVDNLVANHPGEATALDGILDPVIASELIALAGGVGSQGLAWRVAPLVKGLSVQVCGLANEKRAQITRGGIDVAALNPATLALRPRSGLYACGEAIDVDGACGGFNLAWAWLSGLRAGQAAATRAH